MKQCPSCGHRLSDACFPHPEAKGGRRCQCYLCYYTPSRLYRMKRRNRDRVANLDSSYVADLLGVSVKHAPHSLVALKAANLRITRLLKGNTK
jgi:hypothetical protein